MGKQRAHWYLSLTLGLLICPPPDAAAQGRQNQLDQLAVTGTLYGHSLPPDDRNEAGEVMIEVASEIQALYDLGGGTTGPVADVREEIGMRSEVLIVAVDRLIGFIDEVSEPPDDTESLDPTEGNYDARSLRLVTLYLEIADSLTAFVNGERVEGEALDRLRAVLTSMGELTQSLAASHL